MQARHKQAKVLHFLSVLQRTWRVYGGQINAVSNYVLPPLSTTRVLPFDYAVD